jgi:hypothetical protein
VQAEFAQAKVKLGNLEVRRTKQKQSRAWSLERHGVIGRVNLWGSVRSLGVAALRIKPAECRSFGLRFDLRLDARQGRFDLLRLDVHDVSRDGLASARALLVLRGIDLPIEIRSSAMSRLLQSTR